MELSDHLFRRESGRMVAALTRVFGVHNLALAEDVVQESFCRALEAWRCRGIPDNPPAWLMATAKNCALDVLRRERTARTFAPEFGLLLESEWTLGPMMEELFEASAIQDDLLRMIFSCCHPLLPEDAQVALVLNILCGFSVHEVANAFMSSYAATQKRIARAKRTLATTEHLFDVTAAVAFSERLPAVRRALYLLFNEGYHGASPEAAVRGELCRESMRLTSLLLEHPLGRAPSTFALASLMCLHCSRLHTRLDSQGHLMPLSQQNRAQWDQSLIAEGMEFLALSASGCELSPYHVEAAIAVAHAQAADTESTDWVLIVSLYDSLMGLLPTPIVALNRAIAVGKKDGADQGLIAILSMEGSERLASYPFYFAALGEFELEQGDVDAAQLHFRRAKSLARNPMEEQFFDHRMIGCALKAQGCNDIDWMEV